MVTGENMESAAKAEKVNKSNTVGIAPGFYRTA